MPLNSLITAWTWLKRTMRGWYKCSIGSSWIIWLSRKSLILTIPLCYPLTHLSHNARQPHRRLPSFSACTAGTLLCAHIAKSRGRRSRLPSWSTLFILERSFWSKLKFLSLMHPSRVWVGPRVTSLLSYKRQFSEKWAIKQLVTTAS